MVGIGPLSSGAVSSRPLAPVPTITSEMPFDVTLAFEDFLASIYLAGQKRRMIIAVEIGGTQL
jgi:hypothetical protein